jgi:hypothetical protein
MPLEGTPNGIDYEINNSGTWILEAGGWVDESIEA